MDEAQKKAAWQRHFEHEHELREYLSGDADHLILYRAGSIDAEAAKELLLERYPAAEVRPMDPHTVPIWFKRRGQRVWCIGLPGDRPADDLYHPIKPTADACMTMLVWREVHGCRDCSDASDDSCGYVCGGPPLWLRYLDDGARGRWELTDSEAVWAWMQTVRPLKMVASGGYDGDPTMWAWAGRAILRERKRVQAAAAERQQRFDEITDMIDDGRLDEAEVALGKFDDSDPDAVFARHLIARVKEQCREDSKAAVIAAAAAGPFIVGELFARLRSERDEAEQDVGDLTDRLQRACAERDELRKEIACWEREAEIIVPERDRLRAERDEFARAILRLEGERRELRARIKDAESRCNEVSTAGLRLLREALRIGDCVEAGHARDWNRLRKVAQLDSPTDPP
jgi:hypothetical protein